MMRLAKFNFSKSMFALMTEFQPSKMKARSFSIILIEIEEFRFC